MNTLPPQLVAAIHTRIADPKARHYTPGGMPLGAVSDSGEVMRLLEQQTPGSADAFGLVLEQMKAWGQQMPAMHVHVREDGISASSDYPDTYPLAAPATDADFHPLEAAIDRPLPGDLLQMWEIADGGWGPGLSHTTGHGPGISSASGALANLEDLRRRGPGYTGEMAWPTNLLPLTDGERGMISYDLDNGWIVAFDDYWCDRGIAIEQAFTTTHGSLGEWLEEWLSA